MQGDEHVVSLGVKFGTHPVTAQHTSREKHMKQLTTSAYVRAAGLATAVPMVVMILGAGRKF